jgi:hypothetical protein
MCSVGAFLACQECARAIDANQWEELLNRALEGFCGRRRIQSQELKAILRQHLAEFFRQFRENRIAYDNEN